MSLAVTSITSLFVYCTAASPPEALALSHTTVRKYKPIFGSIMNSQRPLYFRTTVPTN